MDEIEVLFNDFLKRYGEEFVKQLRLALEMNYSYAPGFDLNRPTKGTANKIANVNSPSLYDSITAVYDFDKYEAEILMNEYWRWVNQGREKGSYVPIEPLQNWAQKRLGLDAKEARSAAFGISRNIFRFGVAPTFFYDIAVDNLEKVFEKNQEEIAESINDFMENKVIRDIPTNNEITIGL
mgnify:CR=1 FL=1